MRISDWSSDVCSSDLHFVLELLDDLRRNDPQAPVKVELFGLGQPQFARAYPGQEQQPDAKLGLPAARVVEPELLKELGHLGQVEIRIVGHRGLGFGHHVQVRGRVDLQPLGDDQGIARSEEHTSELQSLMRISYAVFCLKKKKIT